MTLQEFWQKVYYDGDQNCPGIFNTNPPRVAVSYNLISTVDIGTIVNKRPNQISIDYILKHISTDALNKGLAVLRNDEHGLLYIGLKRANIFSGLLQ